MSDGARPSLGTGLDEPVEDRFGRGPVDERFADVADPLADLPDDLLVDVADAVRDTKIREVLDRLDQDLVALREVKRRVREIAALLLVDRLRRKIGLDSEPPTLHMSFTGNPGTGKTTVAERMGEVLHKLGYLRRGHVVSVTRDDLVGQYVGHTAPKTREVLKRAMGGVLFIDEAYHIYRVDNERDYGQETVEMLLQIMESGRADLVVIMAGYKDKIDRFFTDVPGLSSRIGHHIDFPDYSPDELMDIGQLMLSREQYRFTPEAEAAFRDYLERRMEQPRFANGRSVRNALDRLRMRHANRLWDTLDTESGKVSKADLVTITAADIRASRVFDFAHDPETS
jgi:probable Rubsico expression protein CbbX